MAKKSPKRRNRRAQDTTLINLNALKKRVTALEKGLKVKFDALFNGEPPR
jgi:hypothetical protein